MSAPAANPTARAPHIRRSALAAGALIALTLAWIVGQIARDACWATGMCFYIPSAGLAFLLLASGLVYGWCKARRACVLCLAAALMPLALVLLVENQWTREPVAAMPGEDSRLVHWNICRGWAGEAALAASLRRFPADVYVLSEVTFDINAEHLAALLDPKLTCLRMSNMVILARGELEEGYIQRRYQGRACSATWYHDNKALRVLAVDLPSSLLVARDPYLRWVDDCIRAVKPDVVVGDFNAPRRSRALASLPTGYTHAYYRAGSGVSYTWPAPVPMYAIDHCLVRENVSCLSYELYTAWFSDHRLQTLRFQWCVPSSR